MHKPISDLSKGLKQRVGLAHAMMADPEILILDEPTSGLDPNQIVEIRRIIKEIGKEKTIIFSTHILSEAEATCDRIVIINKGVIVANGTTEEIKQSAEAENSIEVTLKNCDFTSFKSLVEPIPGISSVSKLPKSTTEETDIKVICEHDKDPREAIYNIIKKNDWILLNFQLKTNSLENIFRTLTTEN
jgi:ABC-2 type transport system ATP-binding protein